MVFIAFCFCSSFFPSFTFVLWKFQLYTFLIFWCFAILILLSHPSEMQLHFIFDILNSLVFLHLPLKKSWPLSIFCLFQLLIDPSFILSIQTFWAFIRLVLFCIGLLLYDATFSFFFLLNFSILTIWILFSTILNFYSFYLLLYYSLI